MAYRFGAGNADHIAVTGLTPWTTRTALFARFSLATTPRTILSAAGSIGTFLDFAPGAANQVRFGSQDAAGVTQVVSWLSGFTAGVIHTLVGTIDLTLGSNHVALYADEDPTAKAELTSALGPLTAATAYHLGGDGGTASLAGTLYELAYWARHALNGAQAAQLGAADGLVVGNTLPTDYWPLVNNADARFPYGGAYVPYPGAAVVPARTLATVTGATLVPHAGINRGPWPRRHSSVGVAP